MHRMRAARKMIEEMTHILMQQGIDVGDEWPHDIEKAEADSEHIDKMTEWMNRYYEAVQEMEEIFEEE